MLPRIRRDVTRKTGHDWLTAAILPGYPKPGIGLCVDLYQPQDPSEPWMVFPYSDPEVGK